MAAPDIRLVKYTGEYGPNLDGLLTDEFSVGLQHNIHIRAEFANSVADHWGFVKRGVYRLWEQPLSLVNLGDAAMELGNSFKNPQFYQTIIGGPAWARITRGVFSYRFDGGESKELRAIILWDSVPAGDGFPKAPSSFLNAKLTPGWGAVVAAVEHAPIDITDLPDGEHNFSLTVTPPGARPDTIGFNFTLTGTDLRFVS